MALVEQLGDDGRWYVQLAAIWHQYFSITQLYNFCLFLIVVSVHSFFCLFFFNINKLEWSMIPACPSLTCSFNRCNIDICV